MAQHRVQRLHPARAVVVPRYMQTRVACDVATGRTVWARPVQRRVVEERHSSRQMVRLGGALHVGISLEDEILSLYGKALGCHLVSWSVALEVLKKSLGKKGRFAVKSCVRKFFGQFLPQKSQRLSIFSIFERVHIAHNQKYIDSSVSADSSAPSIQACCKLIDSPTTYTFFDGFIASFDAVSISYLPGNQYVHPPPQ